MANLPTKPSVCLTITNQVLFLILISRVYYNFSYRAIDLSEVIFDASFSRNQELVIPQLTEHFSMVGL